MVWVFVFLCLLLGYFTFNLFRKNEKLEDFVISIQGQIIGVLDAMKAIDNKQMFEKDDEVGIIFSELVAIVNRLQSVIESESEDENETPNT